MEHGSRHVSKVPVGSTPPGSGPSQHLFSTSTDNIASRQQTAAAQDASLQQPGESSDSDPRQSLASEVSLPSILLSPSVNGDAEFTGRAIITIRLADARPPVLVWTSLNSWQAPLEMVATGTHSETYLCQVDNVPEQSFQYKVRVGDRWVLDDDMPIAQDPAGNHNNVGYTEHIPRVVTPNPSGETPDMVNRDPVRSDLQRVGNTNVLLPLVYIPPLDSGHAQTDMEPTTSEATVARNTPDVYEELAYHVESGTDTEQEAPLLRHETFQEERDRPQTEDDLRRGLRPRSPPMSTIQEETTTNSDNGGTGSQPGTPSSLEQARAYQRALIEAIPTSIADGFTRASVLLPVRPPDAASEFDNAPLMRHETITTPGGGHQTEQQDELSHAPLMRHETGLGYVDDTHHQNTDELEQAPLMRHETIVASSEPDELDHAPLMRHETNVVSSANSELDGLDHAPLMRFETILSPGVAYADSAERRVSYGTTLVDDDADEEITHPPLMQRETMPVRFYDSEQSSLYSERMMFPMDTSNPPTLVGPPRSSSVYSTDVNEVDRAPTLLHELPDWYASDESAFDNWIDPRAAPDYNAGITYYEAEDSSDDESVGELDRAPTMPHEVGNESVGELDRAPTLPHEAENSASSSSSGTDELDSGPMLSHEAPYANETNPITGSDGASSQRREAGTRDTDAASQRSKARRIISGEDALLSSTKTNSFTSERLREAFKNRIFGATRRPTLSRDASDENEFDFAGAPLLAHEQTNPVPDRSSSDSFSSSRRQRSTEIPDFASFARRSSTGIFRSQRSNLPHRMPRSDEEDMDLHDSSLEIFPMDRDQVFGRVRDISNRLAEDQVQSPVGDLDSPAVMSYTSSSVNLVPIRSSSTMSLHSIREDASENEDELSQLPSPVLMLASRVPKSAPIDIPKISQQRTNIIHGEGKIPNATDSRRYGKIFETVALPAEPLEANAALPPKTPNVSFNGSNDAKEIDNAKHRCRTPYPEDDNGDEEDYQGGNIARKFCAHFRACFPSRNAR
ncbi:hypothetical protein P171DRAFT_481312 [Karstenula rhodostoma CBS 690.94]|uniref:AMP-activated protein kinase glycogen-binding domain-containing protein n=1 Tax=Karstenula rhodostoma CBS 690.94 TaxID=1392251 RepID=A0A9P4PQC7_9PLEO|nr:hypothetical protein P171DRAFT_481312 [Karstenula rhodostoma CBS 690.94]